MIPIPGEPAQKMDFCQTSAAAGSGGVIAKDRIYEEMRDEGLKEADL